MAPTLSAALRTARVNAGLSQRQLGEAVGVGQPAISRIETGRRCPSLAHFAAMVRALDLDAAKAVQSTANQVRP